MAAAAVVLRAVRVPRWAAVSAAALARVRPVLRWAAAVPRVLPVRAVLPADSAAAVLAAAVLLDHATLKSADSSARKQTLTVTLTNGLKLQLGVSGDTVSACGKWSCPEFFDAFESGL